MENLEWVDKRNDVDDVNADDINLIAHYAQELNKNKAESDSAFDYYYETDTLNWDDNNYKRVGIHKIHVNSSTPLVAIVLTRNWMSGLSQLRILSNQLSFRLIKSTGEMLGWVGYVNQDALDEQFDEKLGDIDTALNSIIAMQNELIGGGEV